MKKDNAYFGIIFGLAAVSAIAYLTWLRTQDASIAPPPYESGLGRIARKDVAGDVKDDILPSPFLPSQAEIQQMLVDRGYDIEIDGVIGKESRRVWDMEICNQHAKKYFGM